MTEAFTLRVYSNTPEHAAQHNKVFTDHKSERAAKSYYQRNYSKVEGLNAAYIDAASVRPDGQIGSFSCVWKKLPLQRWRYIGR